jgi:hypothetical protein
MKKPLGYEEWVREFLSRVAKHLNLSGWTLRVEFSDEEKGNSYAEATVNSNYQHLVIHVYGTAKKDFESGQMTTLIMALVHEVCHTFLDPFHDLALPHLSETSTPYFMNILEQQTQKLTMAFLKNLPKNLFPPR